MADEKSKDNEDKASKGSGVNMLLLGTTIILAGAAISLSIVSAALAKRNYDDKQSVTTNIKTDPYPEKAGNTFYDATTNTCAGKKPEIPNIKCVIDEIENPVVNQTRYALGAAEQAGGNVTKGYNGDLDAGDRKPFTNPYYMEGMCPVNVHWHLGAEHLSVGQYDENGKGPAPKAAGGYRKLAKNIRQGLKCHHYDAGDEKFTKTYDWKHCTNMHVGETYEVHWPHSNMGECGTPNQYQSPFYDGVFCKYGTTEFPADLSKSKIGVQAQIFTIVNDDAYYYPDLMKGMIVNGDLGTDVAKYTGSTTGDSRSNTECSQYAGITWQVDRKCHLISASSFDKMCKDMGTQRDDMSSDFYPHGSREIVADYLAANNQVRNLR